MERIIKSEKGCDVMAWIEPKTDWAESDRFNIGDYNRLKGNLIFLHEQAEELYPRFQIADMGADKSSYADYFYADEFNKFEENLETINESIFTQALGVRQTFFDNGVFIQYDELNRLESGMLKIYEVLNRQKIGQRRLSFRLGNMKGVRI